MRRGASEIKERPAIQRALRREQRRLSVRIRRIREELGLTREAAAERIGMSTNQLGRLERAEANVTLATLVACSLAYKVQLAALFSE